MLNQKRWTKLLLGSAVVLSLALGGSAVFAQAGEPTETEPSAEVQEGDRGSRGHRGNKIGHSPEFLAEALGISVDELEAAKQAVRDANEGARLSKEERTQQLADELGISVEELEAAKEAAHDAAIEQAVADGLITQEEADLIAAKQALREYIDRGEIMASVLGVTVEELEAAKEAGIMDELVEASGLTREEIREMVDAAKDTAVQEAIEDGIITAEQAEQLENMEGHGGKRGGRGGNSGRGPRDGNSPAPAGDNA